MEHVGVFYDKGLRAFLSDILSCWPQCDVKNNGVTVPALGVRYVYLQDIDHARGIKFNRIECWSERVSYEINLFIESECWKKVEEHITITDILEGRV